ncbi:polyprenyl synthetase family protein [Dermatobacter hominis]|uniref:polyprenyl synthetase family protein n=1 Tax=Dermatobacter hominis TaxID=2884263 RepID=UPI001D10E80E|nr:polyprenyl synthetase family protein [Dermatobacter hominis]UDY34939.1 polyprenyl synthetase family protein [Dermatobacter hominis]
MSPSGAELHPLSSVATLVDRHLAALLEVERGRWSSVDPDLDGLHEALTAFVLDGGKRIRPAFAYWTFLGAGGEAENPAVLDLCSGLELLHAFALLHDDVMDGSDTRRHHETAHVSAARRHRGSGWRGESRRYGEGVAILLGDLALTLADRTLDRLDRTTRSIYGDLKAELVAGQYLDLLSAARGDLDLDRSRRILVYKSARYTVERPMQLGAALAGRHEELVAAVSRVGAPLGEAFQLRDDVLGVFGSADAVGKPVGDDLREGKATMLISLAAARADEEQRAELELLGTDLDGATIERLTDVIRSTGALDLVERRIEELTDLALDELARLPVTEPARAALAELAAFVGGRRR